MAVLNAQYKHPTSGYSQGLKTLIDSMLKVNPEERPDIQQVPLFLCPTYNFSTHVISGSWCNRGPTPLRMRFRSFDQRAIYIPIIFHGLPRSVIMVLTSTVQYV